MEKVLEEIFKSLDSSTYNHSIRVMDIALEVEQYLRLPDHNLSSAGLLHDIGKFYIPMNILDKVGKLSPLEKELMDLHSYFGYQILEDFGLDEDVCRIVLYHHGINPITIKEIEPYDKASVLDQAYMLHSIDEFEALTSDRPYHRGVPARKALEIMQDEANHHPKVLEYISKTLGTGSMASKSAIHRNSISATNLNLHFMQLIGA
jgi:putative nucleotidyltransferase with HDIG domain